MRGYRGLLAHLLPVLGLLALLLPQPGFGMEGSRAAAVPPPAQTIVVIGDSIARGMYDEQGLGGWVGRLADTLRQAYPAQPFRVINAGINGDTSAGVLRRLTRDVVSARPGLVIVAIGTNDFDYGVPAAIFRANLQTILTRLQHETSAAILVQSFLPEVRVDDAVLHREAAYNAIVPQVCRSLNIGYQDLFNMFLAMGRAAMTSLRHDSEHPTAAGYRLMAATTAVLLESSYLSPAGTLLSGRAVVPGDDLLPDDSLDAGR